MENTTHIRPRVDRRSLSVNPSITDRFGRTFNYLRLAVNEYCNLRCIYCMPEEGIPFKDKEKLITTKEIFKLIRIMTDMGVSKIRFTGGEPLLREDIPDLIHYASEISTVDSVNLTTNGLLLPAYLESLEQAGLTGINISLDTLNTEKFKAITRRNGLDKVIEGLDMAIKSNIGSIKVNVVAMRDFNDNEILDFAELTNENDITVRFIELMPFDTHQIWKTGKFYRAEQIVNDLKSQIKELNPVSGSNTEYHVFQIQGYSGKVAVIPSYTRSLCGNCNRIRITADGKLLNCLYSQTETNIRDAIRNGESNQDIKNMIRNAMTEKLRDGWTAQNLGQDQRESMTQIGG
ncbi:MAG: GTP 3',8-cyclase MoaA [Candidatus Neomarinimicrobiota bacterium]|nr:GTP 3',8-cyclase MoaA [Candidatus Neomarinimicrobiota bacterium]